MTHELRTGTTLPTLDRPTAALVRLSARITGAGEASVRAAFSECVVEAVSDRWVEELVLQSYLFAGFPRALNAAREWRRSQGVPAGRDVERTAKREAKRSEERSGERSAVLSPAEAGESYAAAAEWLRRGEETCERVYGQFYENLRTNIRGLHPRLDEWMIVEGYGKVLSRPGLDLARRELCIVAACVAAGQDRQLHSHLHGALHAGAARETIVQTLDALNGVVEDSTLHRARLLFARVTGK